MKPRSKTLPKLTNDQYKIMDGTDSWGAKFGTVCFYDGLHKEWWFKADLCVSEDLRCFLGGRESLLRQSMCYFLSVYLSTGLASLSLGSFPGGGGGGGRRDDGCWVVAMCARDW